MQILTEKVFHLNPPGGIFDDSSVRNLFPEASAGARKQFLHRALIHGEIQRLKRGLFILGERFRRSTLHPFAIAALLHSPSHISLESALSFHGLIPEAVLEITSVTPERSRCYSTPLGEFSYHRVPTDEPRSGVDMIKVDGEAWAFVAGPLRAIADLVYLRKEVTWEKEGVRFLTESMRMEKEDLYGLPLGNTGDIIRSLRNRRTKAYLEGLKMEISR